LHKIDSRTLTDLLKLLLADPRVDPAAESNLAIQLACQEGHTEVFKLLLSDPRVDPTADEDFAFRIAR